MTDIKTQPNQTEQNKRNFWDKMKSNALNISMSMLVGAGALIGAGSALAENAKDVKVEPNTAKITNTIPQKTENTTDKKPQLDANKANLTKSNLAVIKDAKPEIKPATTIQTPPKPSQKLADLKAKHSPISQNNQKNDKLNPLTPKTNQAQPKTQTVGELTQQNTGSANALKDPKRNTFNQVNAHFDKLNTESKQTQTQNPKKVDQQTRPFSQAKVTDFNKPEITTNQIVGNNSLNAVKTTHREVSLSNNGVLRPTLSKLEVSNINFGLKNDGNYQLDFKSRTFNATTIPITEKRIITQNRSVISTNIETKQNLILQSQENGQTINRSIFPATKITANLLTGQTTRSTTNPSLGFVPSDIVAKIKEPGFYYTEKATLGIKIIGAGIQPVGDTSVTSDNTQTNYGLVLSSGEQNRKVVISGDQAAISNNTRNFVVIPDQKDQVALLATNMFGQVLPQLDVNLINNGKGDPSRLNPDLIPFSSRVYRGDNPALEIANSSISFSPQLVVGQAIPPITTYGISLNLADRYVQSFSQKNTYSNLSPERSIFSRSFDPINANLNISANIDGVTFNSNNVNVYPEIQIDLTTQTGIKNTFTTSNKTIYRIPKFAAYIQERSRTQITQLVTGFTVDTVNKFEINPFLEAVFAQYDQNGSYYFTLAGQVYMIPNDSQRSKIDGIVGTNIKLGDVLVQPFFRAVYNFGGVKRSDKANLAIIGLKANLGSSVSIDLGQFINVFPDSTTGTTAGIGYNSGDFSVKVNTYSLNTGSGTSAEVSYSSNKNTLFTIKYSSGTAQGVLNPSNQFSVLWNSSW